MKLYTNITNTFDDQKHKHNKMLRFQKMYIQIHRECSDHTWRRFIVQNLIYI